MANFLENFRESVLGIPTSRYGNKTNNLIFRDAKENEKTGIQELKLVKNNGDFEKVYLMVPERESVGYGEIGLGKSPNLNFWYWPSEGKSNWPGETSKGYHGKNKAVGMSLYDDDSEGQILGLVDANGKTYSAKGAKDFLQNLGANGYKKIFSVEEPEMEQEHNGPAYVPGDLLLKMFGFEPNRGAVGFKFKEPQNHEGFQNFLKNLRGSSGNK